jgi:hypothetical protein
LRFVENRAKGKAMAVSRFRFTMRRMMIVVAIVSLPLAVGAYRYRAGRLAALAEARVHDVQARAARAAEQGFLQQARSAAGTPSGANLAAQAAGACEEAKTSEKIAGEILDRYGIRPEGTK